MEFDDLKDYKPEVPKEGNEPFDYEGSVIIEESIVGPNTREGTEFYPAGCNMIAIKAIVMEGENSGRNLFKKFNLDSVETDKKGKTPIRKLADQFWAVGLSFKNMDELIVANNKFVGMNVHIKAWSAKFKDRDQQMWNIKSISNGVPSSSSKPAF